MKLLNIISNKFEYLHYKNQYFTYIKKLDIFENCNFVIDMLN